MTSPDLIAAGPLSMAVLWARSNPNPKLQKEIEAKTMRDEEDLELKETEVDNEVNDKGGDG